MQANSLIRVDKGSSAKIGRNRIRRRALRTQTGENSDTDLWPRLIAETAFARQIPTAHHDHLLGFIRHIRAGERKKRMQVRCKRAQTNGPELTLLSIALHTTQWLAQLLRWRS